MDLFFQSIAEINLLSHKLYYFIQPSLYWLGENWELLFDVWNVSLLACTCRIWMPLRKFDFKSGKCPKGMSLLYLQLLAHGLFCLFVCLCLSNIQGSRIQALWCQWRLSPRHLRPDVWLQNFYHQRHLTPRHLTIVTSDVRMWKTLGVPVVIDGDNLPSR